jgi:predicted methyltransferase
MFPRVFYLFAGLSLTTTLIAEKTNAVIPESILIAVADSHRPPEQSRLDAQRKPEQLLAFAGIKAGDRIGDFMPGNAYFTRIFSNAVGPTGQVYAFIPSEEIKNCPPAEVAGSRVVERDPLYRNVVQLTGPVNQFSTPHLLDVLWTSQNYHDLHDTFMGPADIGLVNKAFFQSLKPGGVLIIIDHAAAAGSGLRDTDSLHRIDPKSVRKEIQAAGFVFEAQSDVLKNVYDDHARSVFDSSIRGKTDQFVYRFRKPEMPR